MTGHILQAYDVSILLGTYVVIGLMVTCLYLLQKDIDEFEYAISYIALSLLFISSTITGLALSYYFSDVSISGINLILILSIFVICSVITSIPIYYLVQRNLKRSIFIGTFSLFVIDIAISFMILFGVTITQTLNETLPILGLNGGSGLVVFASAIGLCAFVLSVQVEEYIIELSDLL